MDKETLSELLREAAPVIVPPKALQSSVPEDEELAELECLLEIDVREALGMGLAKVHRWFLTSNNTVAALELQEVIERGGDVALSQVEPLVGHWGNIIDPLDTMWVCRNKTPYDHNEALLPRRVGGSLDLLNAEFEEGE